MFLINSKLLLTFIFLNIANVIIQTVKTLVTVKCGKFAAALANAIAFGLYTVVTVYMLCELPLGVKSFVVAFCNLVGVYIVKSIEEKVTKERLWKVEATVPIDKENWLATTLKEWNIPFYGSSLNQDQTLFCCFCESKEKSRILKEILTQIHAKFFVVEESKQL